MKTTTFDVRAKRTAVKAAKDPELMSIVQDLKKSFKGAQRILVTPMDDELVTEGYNILVMTHLAGTQGRLGFEFQICRMPNEKIQGSGWVGYNDVKKDNLDWLKNSARPGSEGYWKGNTADKLYNGYAKWIDSTSQIDTLGLFK